MSYYMILLFLYSVSAQGLRARVSLYVTGRNNDTYKVDGYSSYKTYVNSVEGLLSDKIRDTYNFVLQFSESPTSVLLSYTTPEKLVFLQLLHSFDLKNSSFTNFLLNVADICSFPTPNSFREWINEHFDFPSEKIYEIIKYISLTKPPLIKPLANQIFYLNIKYNVLKKAVAINDVEVVKWLFEHSTDDENTIDAKVVQEVWINGKIEIMELFMRYDKISNQNLPLNLVNESFKNKETLLHIASRSGYDNAVKLLTTNLGANINARDDDGRSPLFRAVENNHHKVVEILIGEHAEISTEPLLALAVLKGHVETVKSLVKLNVPFQTKYDGEDPFSLAVKRNNIKILELLTSVDESKKAVEYFTNDFGDTLMHSAAASGSIDSVKTLKKLGAAVDSKNNYGETPLFKAVKAQNLEIMNILINLGANIETRTNHGDTILHSAAFLGNFEIVKFLLNKFTFSINVKNSNGETPVYKAALAGKCEILKFLLENGGDINTKNNGMSMLHEAAADGNEKALMCLINIGMDTNIKGFWEITPLHQAVSHGHERIVQRLLENKADPNTKNRYHWTPLHQAALKNNIPIIKLLLQHNANINEKNEAGKEPCILALEYQQTEACELLCFNKPCVNKL